ncbi:hypothetical protein U1Q18_019098 [Sarracenia purpurea var. burkii]
MSKFVRRINSTVGRKATVTRSTSGIDNMRQNMRHDEMRIWTTRLKKSPRVDKIDKVSEYNTIANASNNTSSNASNKTTIGNASSNASSMTMHKLCSKVSSKVSSNDKTFCSSKAMHKSNALGNNVSSTMYKPMLSYSNGSVALPAT